MATTSSDDDRKFGEHFLCDIIEWIAENFEPTDVFKEDALKEWIQESWDPDDVFDWDVLKELVRENWDPASVFTTGRLIRWALGYGFRRPVR